ncbi:hypothetical protein [Streptomyces sp. NPDC057413]|uniref:hypothetical protein n=1 Tax=Streptomyces sp. NPDC057413 TaxID=3346124 RepID=UPI00367F049D
MGEAAKRGRRKAAPASLRYERTPRGRQAAGAAEKKSDTVLGCLAFLACAGVLVVWALLDHVWGDDAYRWASHHWPGGAYAFAACVGLAGPGLTVLACYCLATMRWKSWKQHPARTLTRTTCGLLSTTALVPYVVLVFNAQDTGAWGRGSSTRPSWVFSHYPWLWAVGLLASATTTVLLVCGVRLRLRLRRSLAREAAQ